MASRVVSYVVASSGVLLNIAAYFLVVPILPEFQVRYLQTATACGQSVNSAAECGRVATIAWGATKGFSALGIFLLSPMYGSLSDRLGRRSFLLAAMCAQLCPMLAAWSFPLDLRYFYLTAALAGFAPDTQAISFAILADIVPAAARLQKFGLASACVFGAVSGGAAFSVLLRPVLGLDGLIGFSLAVGCLATVIVAAVLPETAPAGYDSSIDGIATKTPPVVRAKSLVNVIRKGPASQSEALMRHIAIIGLISFIPQDGVIAISMFYAKERLALTGPQTSKLAAQMLGIVGLGSLFWQTAGLAALRKAFSGAAGMYQVAMLTNILHLVGYGVMWAPWVYLLNAFLAGGAMLQPIILRAFVSQAFPPETQGRASGVISSVAGATSSLGPLMFGSLFWVGDQHDAPWLPYAIGVLLLLVSSGLTAAWLPGAHDEKVRHCLGTGDFDAQSKEALLD
eukprot:TRINITY_DN64094_c0_g1_i1.p1 TRINITY_DN64094_c0_g1~~TRINITY_DN64094_c0_g1_i1.p1  ORF type:complete len:454 (+),score=45.65 TRINITY_DN64094_c0_g1_i1:53-1414(+)